MFDAPLPTETDASAIEALTAANGTQGPTAPPRKVRRSLLMKVNDHETCKPVFFNAA
jgi:hypothetical protein